MKIAVSTIAWDDPFDPDVLDVLRGEGVEAIELAPTMLWQALSEVDGSATARARHRFSRAGFNVVAMQALLFGRPDLQLFGERGEERALLDHLGHVCRIGGELGAQALVFGSPRNRRRGDLIEDEAMDRACDVFSLVAEIATREGTTIVLEPNPPEYGADFIRTADEAMELVRRVGHPGFRLHLDTGCLRVAGADIPRAVRDGAKALHHFHVSEPDLAPVPGDGGTPHEQAAKALADVEYDGWVSIEMRRAGDRGRQMQNLMRAVHFTRAVYGDPRG